MTTAKRADRPVMQVVAGPPGSGKTTYFPVGSFGVDAFSIDDRCAQIVGSYRAIPAQVRKAVSHECETFVLSHIRGKRSFAVETTLRTSASVGQATRARRRGFRTEMIFLSTGSAEINVERVLQRAQAGGHAASESEIRASYTKALTNVRAAIKVFDRCEVYDTSEPWAPPRLVLTTAGGKIDWMSEGAQPWIREALGSTPRLTPPTGSPRRRSTHRRRQRRS